MKNKNELNYQQARIVRKQSLKDVIADELIRGKGLGSAITGAIGLKTQALVKGIKAKFDPLNLVKFLTFGSRLGPALYGKLFGRSQKDVEYFTGRAKPIGRGRQKLVKDGEEGDENTGGMKTILKQILTFLQKSHESDMTLREKENNLRESNKLDDDVRHKELLKALGVKTEPTATLVESEKPKEDNGVLNGLMATIGKMIAGIESKINAALESIKNIAKMLGTLNNISKLIRTVGLLRGLLFTPVLMFLAGMALWEFDKWVTRKVDEAMDDAEKEAIALGDVKSLRQHLENRNKKNLDKAARTGDSLDAGVYTDSLTIGNIMVNPAETRKKLKESFEMASKIEPDQLKRQNAIKALDEIQADTEGRKLEYLKKNNIESATPQQLKDAQDYADEKIDIKGLPTWVKPAIPERPKPQTKEGQETLTTIQQIPTNFWKWAQQPDPAANSPDEKMYNKMFEVIQENPLGPWNFNEKIPGYNQWNKTIPNTDKPTSFNNLMQENLDLTGQLAVNRSKVISTSPAIASASTSPQTQSRPIPMPSVRMAENSYKNAVYSSFG